MKPLTKRLRMARTETDLSQLDVSQRTGMSYRRYWEIENGYRVASDAERARIAKTLKVSESVLFDMPEESAVAR